MARARRGGTPVAEPERRSSETRPLGLAVSAAAVGLILRPLFGLHEHNLTATVFAEHLNQPVVEVADLQNGHETALSGHLTDLLQERMDALPFGAHLPPQNDISCFIAHTRGQLLAMLVDSKV
jgi:hypothetical protein